MLSIQMRLIVRILTLALLWANAGVIRADDVVVIGSFAKAENASSLVQLVSASKITLPIESVRSVPYLISERLRYRVVLVPADPADPASVRSLQRSAQAAGYAGAWVAPLPVSQQTVQTASTARLETDIPEVRAPVQESVARQQRLLTLEGEPTVSSATSDPGLNPGPSGETSLSFRVKGFISAVDLPTNDLYQEQLGDWRQDSAVDLRSMLRHDRGNWSVELAHTTLVQQGDSLLLGQVSADTEQVVVSDDARAINLTEPLNQGRRHRTLHRLDRFNVQWRSDRWAFTLGRQAVSWGSGIVFQPLDPFNPFAPTAVDRDYKVGNDLVLIEGLFDSGHDVQLLHIFRRDRQDSIESEVASTAVKWHGYAGVLEFELIAAQHVDTDFFGVSGRLPVGPAVLRSDIALRRGIDGQSEDPDWGVLGIVNIDVAFPWRNRTAYVFAEYFHNDFGLASPPTPLSSLPADLAAGLSRGEFFNLMRDYLAVGGSLQWHPLFTQQLTLIANLHDSSNLLQMQLAYDVGQNQSLQLGWIGTTGGRGDEFAPLEVAGPPLGQTLTQGGGDRIYMRWAAYF